MIPFFYVDSFFFRVLSWLSLAKLRLNFRIRLIWQKLKLTLLKWTSRHSDAGRIVHPSHRTSPCWEAIGIWLFSQLFLVNGLFHVYHLIHSCAMSYHLYGLFVQWNRNFKIHLVESWYIFLTFSGILTVGSSSWRTWWIFTFAVCTMWKSVAYWKSSVFFHSVWMFFNFVIKCIFDDD